MVSGQELPSLPAPNVIMDYSHQPLQTFRLRNFKAVRDSGEVRLTPLTVLIGNNGCGKSSFIEGLETFRSVVTQGLDAAMEPWLGLENVLNFASERTKVATEEGRPYLSEPLSFALRGNTRRLDEAVDANFSVKMEVGLDGAHGDVFVTREQARMGSETKLLYDRINAGTVSMDFQTKEFKPWMDLSNHNESFWMDIKHNFFNGWQFLALQPESMGVPRPQRRAAYENRLAKDGSDIGDFLVAMLRAEGGPDALAGIVETLRYVLPYAKGVQPVVATQIQRTVFLQLAEAGFQVPGWLLSTGTLRVLALLAVLRHPDPPPLLCVEEIENGLDPRTLNLLVEEIAQATESGRTQVVCTTHSPYFLDLIHLSQIVVVERDEDGQPAFIRPGGVQLDIFKRDFAPGQLYTMGQLNRGEGT